jgi:hypothetical protein
MKRRTTRKPTIKDWNIDLSDLTEVLSPAIFKVIDEILDVVLEETSIDFPAIWGDSDGAGGPPVDDPLTVYLSLNFDGEDYCFYEVSLREPLVIDMEDCRSDGSYADGLERVARGLRDLAAEIDAAVAEGRKHP